MKTITENWNKFVLKETKNHYQVEILLKYADDLSLYGEVFNKIRAIPGITIVKVKEGEAVKSVDTADVKVIRLNIKFIPPPAAMSRYLAFLRTQLMKIKDEHGEKVVAARFVTAPRDTSRKKS